ncbi:MAG: hypothetical protein KIT27_07240 [Legionellales bacterium]|nr:hypothetical protein [Legionellales bacterium]
MTDQNLEFIKKATAALITQTEESAKLADIVSAPPHPKPFKNAGCNRSILFAKKYNSKITTKDNTFADIMINITGKKRYNSLD